MRLRNKNWTANYIEENKKCMIQIKENEKINLAELFEGDLVYLEIGCGKGKFSIDNSLKYLNKNFIAMEKESTVIGVALKKAIETYGNNEFKNLRFLNMFAEKLTDIFELESIEGIFLNFSDPWPKTKHYKKRLTYSAFLEDYWSVLKPGGIIEIKTDNDGLFAFSIEQIIESDFEILYSTVDLYNDKNQIENNVSTEYESKFHSMGKNINKIIIKKTV